MPRIALSLALFVSLAACGGGGGGGEPVVTVYHRCGELNFDELQGLYGRLDSSTGVNSRFRVAFERTTDAVTMKWVGGNVERFLMKGTRTGNETMTFEEIGGPADPGGAARRIKASITTDCRLQLDHFYVRGAGEQAIEAAEGLNKFVPYLELERLDFEPCTEPLYIRSAAKSRSKATGGTMRPTPPPTVKEDKLPIGTYGPASELSAGCRATVDVWVDGEAEVIDMEVGAPSQGYLHWFVPYETQYLGEHHLALHRKATCGEDTTILGVACTVIEVQ